MTRKIQNIITQIMEKQWIKGLSILVSVSILCFMIWNRLSVTHLPKKLPLAFTEVSFLIYMSICISSLFIIYALLKSTKGTTTYNPIRYFYQQLELLDNYIKSFNFINNMVLNFRLKVTNDLPQKIYTKMYIFLNIAPKLLISFTLLMDTFVFYELNYYYTVLTLSLIIFLNRYLKYTLNAEYNTLCSNIESTIDIMYIIPLEEDDDEESKMQFITLEKLLQDLHAKVNYDYLIILKPTFTAYQRNILKLNLDVGRTIKSYRGGIILAHELNQLIASINTWYLYEKLSTIFTATITFICWSYIIYISFHTLPGDSFMWLIPPSFINPF